jgi:GLPGLI family protein
MKQFSSILLAAFMLITSVSFAGGKKKGDNKFTGTIVFKISAEGREITPTEQAQMPTETIFYYRENMMRNDNVMPMASVFTITNIDTKETILLLDQMGQKMHMTISSEDMKKIEEKRENDTTNVKTIYNLLEGTKTIAGYNCKKAEAVKGEKKTTIYYTEDIKAEQKEFKDAPGFVMNYTIEIPDDELYLVYQVTTVTTKKPKKTLFSIPNDFSEMPEAYTKQIRSNMGL